MRKLLAVAIASLLIIGFSSAAWCSALYGDWDLTGKTKIEIAIDGERSEKYKGFEFDYCYFLGDGYFSGTMFGGSWQWQDEEKGIFIVSISDEYLEWYYGDLLSDKYGADIDVHLEEATFIGKLKEKKGKASMKVKYEILMSFSSEDSDISGLVKIKCKLSGKPYDDYDD